MPASIQSTPPSFYHSSSNNHMPQQSDAKETDPLMPPYSSMYQQQSSENSRRAYQHRDTSRRSANSNVNYQGYHMNYHFPSGQQQQQQNAFGNNSIFSQDFNDVQQQYSNQPRQYQSQQPQMPQDSRQYNFDFLSGFQQQKQQQPQYSQMQNPSHHINGPTMVQQPNQQPNGYQYTGPTQYHQIQSQQPTYSSNSGFNLNNMYRTMQQVSQPNQFNYLQHGQQQNDYHQQHLSQQALHQQQMQQPMQQQYIHQQRMHQPYINSQQQHHPQHMQTHFPDSKQYANNSNNSVVASTKTSYKSNRQQHPDHHHPSFWLYNIGNTDFYVTSNYEARNILGFGAYGIVIAAFDKKSGSEVAIKKQNLSNFGGNREYLKRLLREIRILHHVDHPSLMCLVDLIPPFDFNHFDSVYIVTQKMDHALKDVIHSKQELKQEHIDFFMYQMTSAIKYLHACNLIHRDLKPENVLINNNCELRLSDFGLSKSVPLGLNPKNSTSIVSLFYRAPELLLGVNQCLPSIDIWSLGTIFAEMYYPARKPLFQSNSCYDALGKILSLIGTPTARDLEGLADQISREGYQFLTSLPFYTRQNFREVFPTASPEALDLIEKMLVFHPARRISAEEALKHPYFKGLEYSGYDTNDASVRPMDNSWEDQFNDHSRDPKRILYDFICEFNLQQNNTIVGEKYNLMGEKWFRNDDEFIQR